eukprot:Skav225334  [mRNA]  locus=scaffold748:284138:289326:- [translate_table: standard]
MQLFPPRLRICDLVPAESEHRWQQRERPAEGWKLLDKATDGSVVKRSVHARDSFARCQARGTCHLHLGGAQLVATLGSGDLCDALEAAVLQMRQGEVAEAKREHGASALRYATPGSRR